jgi:hypothetical protein
MNNYRADLYEVASQSFKDIPLDKQIALKINDWAAEDQDGRVFYGRTAQQVADEAHNFNYARSTI